jgi:hypothetical protein
LAAGTRSGRHFEADSVVTFLSNAPMKTLTASDFSLAAFQASIFTPDSEASVNKFARTFPAKWQGIFDGDLVTLPAVPIPSPVEMPRTILQSTTGWHCEMSPGRLNITWTRAPDATSSPLLSDLVARVVPLLVDYTETMEIRVGRSAAIVSRYAQHEAPGRLLAHHFCRDEWQKAPLNRPQDFELHAHKRYSLLEGLLVNSWVRNKTATLTTQTERLPVVLVEQDINTLAEESAVANLNAHIPLFFERAAAELDSILKLYYPLVNS